MMKRLNMAGNDGDLLYGHGGLWVESVQLTGGKFIAAGVWQSEGAGPEPKWSYCLSADDLSVYKSGAPDSLIGGSVTVETAGALAYNTDSHGNLVRAKGTGPTSYTFDAEGNAIDTSGAPSGAGVVTDNTIYGGAAGESIYGLSGNDFLMGGGGADTVEGGIGSDLLFGGAGADFVNGGDGNDFLRWCRQYPQRKGCHATRCQMRTSGDVV